MKRKVLVAFICSLLFGVLISNVDAQYYRIGANGPSVVHRDQVQTDDTSTTISGHETTLAATPDTVSTAQHDINTVFYSEGYTHAKVYCDISGSSASWDVTPYYWEPSGQKFYPGAPTTVTTDHIYSVAVDHSKYLFMYCDNSSGTSPMMIIRMQGMMEKAY